MEWRDQGIVLTTRKHGEGKAVVTLLTRDHGRHAGLVRGLKARARGSGALEPGTRVSAVWKGRLADQLGSYQLEPGEALGAAHLDEALALAGLNAVTALVNKVLPEREPHVAVFNGLLALLEGLKHLEGGRDWGALLVRFELGLLAELGFGLDFSECAATGQREDLVWVSPKSGRAVSRGAGAAYADRLLPLPGFLISGEVDTDLPAVLQGLKLTGFFLQKAVDQGHANASTHGSFQGATLPESRATYIRRLSAAKVMANGG
ncbi:MAG: DNA repair protein RecO [Magnetovibrionaceae bacterium]